MTQKMPDIKGLFKAGAHFGHQRSRTDARSSRFIYGFQNKIAVIDLNKTRELLEKALDFIKSQAKEGALFLFVGTKLQAKDKVKEVAEALKMPYVIERWPGGLLTNFEVVSKSVKKMIQTQNDLAENKYEYLTKAERLKIERNLKKTQVIFGGLGKLERIPDVLFVVDAAREAAAVREAKRKGVVVVAICDTDANPAEIDYPIVANDDSRMLINLVLDLAAQAIKENYKEKPVVSDSKERLEKKLAAESKVEEKAE
jgi:small subunit ribosomal protein S2